MRDFGAFVWQILFNGAVGAALALDLILYGADYLAKTRGTSSAFSVTPAMYGIIFAVGVLIAAFQKQREAYERGRRAALAEGDLRFDVNEHATVAHRARDGKGAHVLLYGVVRNNGPVVVRLVNPRLVDDQGHEYTIMEPRGEVSTFAGHIGGVGGAAWYSPSRAKMLQSNSHQEVAFHFHYPDAGWQRTTREAHYRFTISDDRGRSHDTEFTCRVDGN